MYTMVMATVERVGKCIVKGKVEEMGGWGLGINPATRPWVLYTALTVEQNLKQSTVHINSTIRVNRVQS